MICGRELLQVFVGYLIPAVEQNTYSLAQRYPMHFHTTVDVDQ